LSYQYERYPCAPCLQLIFVVTIRFREASDLPTYPLVTEKITQAEKLEYNLKRSNLNIELYDALEEESQKLDQKMASAIGDTAIEAKLDEDNCDRRLVILIKHFEADERFYLDVKENFPLEEDHPHATVIVFVDDRTALGYDSSNNYSLVCTDADEVHARIPQPSLLLRISAPGYDLDIIFVSRVMRINFMT
jgi:hypothetical protein